MAEFDELLRAVANPARRAILRRCHDQWVSAGDLCDELGLAPATVSEHLKVLRKTGLVERQAHGTWRRYRTVPDVVTSLAEGLGALLSERTSQ